MPHLFPASAVPTPSPRRRARLVRAATRLAAVAALAALLTSPVGPATAADGTYQVRQASVSAFEVSGFGGGTVYYPSGSGERFGAVAVSPGYTADQLSIAWLGPRLASQGFVVMTIDTLTRYDQPDSRGDQLLAALDYLVQASPARDEIDPDRLAVMGHSMGGGGTLEAAARDHSLRAAIPLTGWDLTKDWSSVTTPTLVIGADGDLIAPVATHSRPFYDSLGTPDKGYIELAGASHLTPNSPNEVIAEYSTAWLKYYVDGDTRYADVLCPTPSGRGIAASAGVCPRGDQQGGQPDQQGGQQGGGQDPWWWGWAPRHRMS